MRLLIIRGDLQSTAGYCAAARDYCAVLAPFFDKILGVDIHFGANRPFQAFPHELTSDVAARAVADTADFTLLLSITTPDHYTTHPRAANVGMTFWETDRLPLQGYPTPPWVSRINAMDAVWAPSTHTKDVFEKAGVTAPITVLPWPMEPPAAAPAGLPEGQLFNLDGSSGGAKPFISLVRLHDGGPQRARKVLRRVAPRLVALLLKRLTTTADAITDPAHRALLCVAQDVPRKALLLLLAEWMGFKSRPESSGWSLILKTGPADPATPTFDLVIKFWEHVQALKHQLGVDRADAYLWKGNFSPADFTRLFTNTAGLVIPSMGEGFCGPAATALALGKPIVAPRHTAMADYLAPDYPYVFAAEPVVVNFVGDPLRVYDPVSAWYVPAPGAIAQALATLAGDSSARRQEVGAKGCEYLLQWCGKERMQGLVKRELARLERLAAVRSVPLPV